MVEANPLTANNPAMQAQMQQMMENPELLQRVSGFDLRA